MWAVGSSENEIPDPPNNTTYYGNHYLVFRFDTSNGGCSSGQFLSEDQNAAYRDYYNIKMFIASDGVVWGSLMSINGDNLLLRLWNTATLGALVSFGTSRTIVFDQSPPTRSQLDGFTYISKVNLFYFKGTKTIFAYNWTLPANKQVTVYVESDYALGPSVLTTMSDGTTYLFFPGTIQGEFLALSLNTKNFEIIDKSGLSDVFLVPVMDDGEKDKIKVFTTRGGFFEVYKQDHRCLVCDPTCKTCFGDLNTQCLSCAPGFSVSPATGRCTIDCLVNQYSVNNSICLDCHGNCQTCKGGTQFDCLSCKTLEFTLIRGTCLKNCPSTEYFDVNTLLCTVCHPRCLSCTGATEYTCTACQSGFMLEENGYCTRICSMGQYLDALNDQCVTCEPACASCYGGSVFNCTSCNSPWTFVPTKNYCQPTCPRGQYIDGASCSNCVNPCTSCTNSTFCLDCIVNYDFLRG